MSGNRTLSEGCCLCKDDHDGGNLHAPSYATPDDDVTTTLRILSGNDMLESDARAYESRTGGRVAIVSEYLYDSAAFASEVRSNADLDEGYFDGFVANPGVAGAAVQRGGFLDLGDYVREGSSSSDLGWLDILPAFRDVITSYDGRMYMLPLDGDLHSLFYRRDVLERFGLRVPRTWDEYAAVAEAVHGREYDGTRLVGSCVGRAAGCSAPYFANTVLAPLTQAGGTQTGHLFDPRDMTPLAGEALAEAIRQIEVQAKFGAEDELEGCGGGRATAINIKHFLLEGTCVLTYNWGDNFKKHLSEDSVVGGLVGVAPTPGSARVLDRETGRLLPCDEDRCPFGTYYDDVGWVNRAPYAAFGGWSAAVAANVSPTRQRLVADFFAFASSKERSSLGVVSNATGPLSSFNGQDPFRKSHFAIEEWEERGYPRQGTETYRDTVVSSLSSKNLAMDIRFPESAKIMDALDKKVFAYLQRVKNDEIAEADRAAERLAVAEEISNEWTSIIEKFDKEKPDSEQTILEQYQRSLGVFVLPQDYNQLGSLRYYGWTLAALVILSSVLFAAWVTINRKTRIVRASQPFFLVLICVGTFLMGSGIFPIGIDDQIASVRGCDIACMSSPWLLGCGFSCAFSALFSKTLRVNKLFGAPKFTRIAVSVRDVIKPFLVQLSLNVALLSAWTGMNPMVWERIRTTPTSTYGACVPRYPSGARLSPIVLFALLNVGTLVAANVQAFRARAISDEFSESKYIAIALASILQAIIIGFPVALISMENPAAYVVVVSSFSFIIAMSLLLLIFVPKVVLVRQKAKEKKAGKDSQTAATESANSSKSLTSNGRTQSDRFYDDDAAEGIRVTWGRPQAEDQRPSSQQKQKLRELKLKLTEQGVNASTLFDEVGLDVSESEE